MRILTININGIKTVSRFDAFCEWIIKQSPSIVCVQETHLDDSTGKDIPGYSSYHSTSSIKSRGTAIYVNKLQKIQVVCVLSPMHGRYTMIRYLDLATKSIWEVWSVYGPYDSGERARFYEWIPVTNLRCDYLIVAGDMGICSAERVASDSQSQKVTRRRICHPLERLIDDCGLIDPIIIDDADKVRDRDRNESLVTWTSPCKAHAVRLDRILIPSSFCDKTKDIANVGCPLSDHKGVVLDIELDTDSICCRKFVCEPWEK